MTDRRRGPGLHRVAVADSSRVDSKGEWRWRLKAANGKIVADSSEGYCSKQGCKAGVDLVKGTTNIQVVEDE